MIENGAFLLNYQEVEGKTDETIIFLHGWSGSLQSWYLHSYHKIFPEFRKVFVDLRGFGQSKKFYKPEAYTPKNNADDIILLLDHIGIEKAIIWGISYGGRMAYATGIYHPDRIKLLISGAVHPYPVDVVEGRLQKIIKRRDALKVGIDYLISKIEEIGGDMDDDRKQRFLANDQQALVAVDDCIINWQGFDNLNPLMDLDVVVYMGEKDSSYLGGALKLKEEVPNIDLHILKDTNHLACFIDRDKVVSIVEPYLEGL